MARYTVAIHAWDRGGFDLPGVEMDFDVPGAVDNNDLRLAVMAQAESYVRHHSPGVIGTAMGYSVGIEELPA